MVNDKTISLIKKFEGCRLKAYKLAGEKYFTIGYGWSYDPSITENTVWTQAQAEAALLVTLQKFEKYVDQYVPIKLNDNQRGALVSYTMNRGLGGLKELVSHSKTIEDYSKNIVKYWGSATRYKDALIKRRKAEKELFDSVDINYPTLKKGAKNDAVRLLQHKLNLVGYNLAEDGIFGDSTLKAVKEYQTANGLNPDGIVGQKTWSKVVDIK
jgi:GH24 family phage-related lysozyme (muramidase)